jgi:hypothetical protein
LGHAGFDRDDLRGALLHQLHTFARQVADSSCRPRHNMTLWQQSQSQNMRQMACIGFIAAMLEAIVTRWRSLV